MKITPINYTNQNNHNKPSFKARGIFICRDLKSVTDSKLPELQQKLSTILKTMHVKGNVVRNSTHAPAGSLFVITSKTRNKEVMPVLKKFAAENKLESDIVPASDENIWDILDLITRLVKPKQ